MYRVRQMFPVMHFFYVLHFDYDDYHEIRVGMGEKYARAKSLKKEKGKRYVERRGKRRYVV